MSEPKDDGNTTPSAIDCPACGKPIPVTTMEGQAKFGMNALTCPHCHDQHFLEVTTEMDPDPTHPRQ